MCIWAAASEQGPVFGWYRKNFFSQNLFLVYFLMEIGKL